jgi:lipopolysaccharide/colanic/teichoic acid biosynthesis glycosyltransferase
MDSSPPEFENRKWRSSQVRRRLVLDIVIGGTLLVLTFPVAVVLSIGSTISLRAWPIFTQDRLGRGGVPFRFAKIRSLPPDAPRYADKYAIQDVPRTRFGTFLRTSHLDELPQLALVVVGRMSLVGPRPEMASVAATFDPAFMEARSCLRPGCTGLWQVSEAADRLIGEAPEYDLYYVEHSCIRLDLWILWRTALQLIPSVGGVTLEQVPKWARPSPRAVPGASVAPGSPRFGLGSAEHPTTTLAIESQAASLMEPMSPDLKEMT